MYNCNYMEILTWVFQCIITHNHQVNDIGRFNRDLGILNNNSLFWIMYMLFIISHMVIVPLYKMCCMSFRIWNAQGKLQRVWNLPCFQKGNNPGICHINIPIPDWSFCHYGEVVLQILTGFQLTEFGYS